MAGIYIHIPFCRSKCPYCNFFSLASKKNHPVFLDAIRKEMELTRDYLAGLPVETLYFGGGTPSLFRPDELPFPVSDISGIKEITIELNPDDVSEEYVAGLQGTAFNRFSIGIQSFHNDELKFLGRTHAAAQGIRAVRLLQDAGYRNISIDLIFGLPDSGLSRWEQNLETAFSLDVPHISAYALTVEQHTPLAWKIAKGKSVPPSDTLQADQFRILMKRMKEAGFLHYEISNFCRPGRFAQHNTNYWKGVPYLGLGPSAHSFNGISRRWNVSNLTKYIESVHSGIVPYEEEILTPEQQFNEYIMTSLRTMWGTDLGNADIALKSSDYEILKQQAARLVGNGLLYEQNGRYFLTEEGILFADAVTAGLFII